MLEMNEEVSGSTEYCGESEVCSNWEDWTRLEQIGESWSKFKHIYTYLTIQSLSL